MGEDFIYKNKEIEYKKYKIITQTPVHIGSGEKISEKNYYYDQKTNEFIVPGEELYEILEKTNKIKEFIESMEKGLKISDFLIRNQKVLEELKKTNVLKIEAAEEKQNDLMISLLQKTNNLPYIPGSSIKGMIKTALYYHFYKKDIRLEKILELEDPKYENMHMFNNLIVRDFLPLKPIKTKVYKLNRIEKGQEYKKRISQYFECIPPKSEFLGEIGIGKDFKIFGEVFNHENMMKWIKEYFADVREDEGYEINEPQNMAHIKIGFGKGVFANSILLAIKQKNPAKFKEIIKKSYKHYKKAKEKDIMDKFPKTRWRYTLNEYANDDYPDALFLLSEE
ncbi:MAG: type III-A CRISPR-associated RAMP protein Csm5 [Candidatus Anstonellaceae archaeon]